MTKRKTDAVVSNHGTVFSVDLETRRAERWWKENVVEGMTLGRARIVEHRYIRDIVAGMVDAGLNVI